MNGIVIALYRPHPGHEDDLVALLRTHGPALQEAGFITRRPIVYARSADGTYLEIVEWIPGYGSRNAHAHPVVGELWRRMAEVSEAATLQSLPEAAMELPHFEPADHLLSAGPD